MSAITNTIYYTYVEALGTRKIDTSVVQDKCRTLDRMYGTEDQKIDVDTSVMRHMHSRHNVLTTILVPHFFDNISKMVGEIVVKRYALQF